MIKYFLLIAFTVYSQEYDRSEWGRWLDYDNDCQDTRQEVLIEESIIPVTLDESGCKVISGVWLCLLTGNVYTDPSLLDIDHVVPLKNAHESGGNTFTKDDKYQYFNNLENSNHLMAVYRGANRSKGAKSPDQWMPEYQPFRCTYLNYWISVKRYYRLTMSDEEYRFIDTELRKCK